MTTRGMNLSGAGALVTGASSGIGAATAEVLSRHGCHLAVLARDTGRLADVARRTGAYACPADLTARDDIDPVRKRVFSTIGAVDLLVGNAGVGWEGPAKDMPRDRLDALVELNVLANLRLVREFLPEMVRRRRGHIVLVSSIAGAMGVPGEAAYSASKAAVRVFGDSLRLELAGSGVGVTVVLPGAVDTAFFDRRGTPYRRRWPPPIPAATVAEALVRGVQQGKQDVFVPGWLRFPARLNGLAPGPITALRRILG